MFHVASCPPALRRATSLAAYGLLGLLLLAFPSHSFDCTHDFSSHAAFEYYAAHHFQFGTQVYQNVGPYGFVHYASTYSGYLHGQKTLLANACRLTLLILIVWASGQLPRPILRFWWWASFFLVTPLTKDVSGILEQPLSYVAIYLAALYLLRGRRDKPFHPVSLALWFFLAFWALTKHTSFMLAVLVVGAVCLEGVVRWGVACRRGFESRRVAAGQLLRPLLVLTAFFSFLLLHWGIAGQRLANLPLFVRGIFAFTSGYNEAMILYESPQVALASLLLVGAFLYHSVQGCLMRQRSVARLLLEIAFLYLIWKYGHVRADSEHQTVFLTTLFLLVPPWFFIGSEVKPSAAAPALPGGRQNLERLAFPAAIMLTLYLFLIAAAPGILDPTPVKDCLARNLRWLLSPGRQRAALEAQLRQAQEFAALPEVKRRVKDATIDFFGSLPGFILLNGLNYWPRPMPISFAACNEFLQKANESFYRDARTAPRYVLCRVGSINERTVFQDDALALRALLDNYHPVLAEGNLLLLERNQAPLVVRAERTLIGDYTLPFSQLFAVENPNRDMLWVEARIEHSWLGKLRSFSYQPPPCFLIREFVGETNRSSSLFITAMGSTGCLINPSIEDNRQLAELFLPDTGLQGFRRVESFAFVCPDGEKYFAPEIKLRCYRVPRPPSSITDVKVTAQP
jgi:hypothetical protein